MPEDEKGYRRNVAIVVFNSVGQVLAGERAGKPGALQFPQGGIDAGESPLEAARRELWEETGLRLDGLPVHESEEWLAYDFPPHIDNPKLRKYRGQQQKWFFFHWDGEPHNLDLDAHHREFDRLIWTDLDTMLERIVDFKKPVYRRIVESGRQIIADHLAQTAGKNRDWC